MIVFTKSWLNCMTTELSENLLSLTWLRAISKLFSEWFSLEVKIASLMREVVLSPISGKDPNVRLVSGSA